MATSEAKPSLVLASGYLEGEISLECSLVLLDMNDDFRLSNTLSDINF